MREKSDAIDVIDDIFIDFFIDVPQIFCKLHEAVDLCIRCVSAFVVHALMILCMHARAFRNLRCR